MSLPFGVGREPVRAFNLIPNTPGTVKFLRGGLYPNAQQGTSYTWNLKDVITAQSVVLEFPNSSLRETLTEVFSFMPLSLLLVIAWVLVLAWRHGLRLEPYRVFVGALGFVLPVVLRALTPFTFLWAGNAGLLLGVIAVVIVLSVLPPDVLGSRFRRPIITPGQ